MATIVTRAGKGAALTHQEVDANFTGLNTELGQKEVASNKGVANGYASLDAAGKVPSTQLPSYVDDVVEVANFASLPGTGETGKIYVTIDTNKTYRWTGSTYIEISASPGSTDSLAEGSTNLYFTQARARASISASGSLSYNSSTGVMSFSDAVTSVAGRTGAVTLTSSDVGLGNVENKSSATIRGEITSSNVTTALGFTPYNATNPSAYISGNQTITVSGDASGSGATSIALTLANSGVSAGTYTKVTVDAKGRVTTGASLASGDLPTYTGTITSSQITTGLGYTPYNSTNPSGYITSSALSSYFPLSGGTITGTALQVGTAFTYDNPGGWNANIVAAGSTHARFRLRATSFSGSGDRETYLWLDNSVTPSTGIYSTASTFAFGGSIGTVQVAGNTVLHAANVGTYALPIVGGTLTGDLQISSNWGGSPVGYNEALTIYGTYPSMTYRSTTTGSVWLHHMQSDGAMTYYYASDAATSSNWAMKARMGIDGQLYYGSGTAVPYLHLSNYGSYALPLSGGTLTGNISFSNGADRIITLGSSTNWNYSLRSEGDNFRIYDAAGTTFMRAYYNGTEANKYVEILGSNLRVYNNGSIYSSNKHLADSWWHSNRDFGSGTLIQTDINYAVTSGDPFVLEIRGNSYGNEVPYDIQYQGYIYNDTLINHGGYSNGTFISGIVAINYLGNLCFWFPRQSYWNGFYVRVYVPHATYPRNRVTNVTDSGKPTTAKEVNLSANIRQSLHSGNFNSYAPTLTGSGASGTWGISISGSAAQLNGYASAENGGNVILRTQSNGYLNTQNWINVGSAGLFSTTTNGSHFRPSSQTFGSWEVIGSKNGYSGIACNGTNHILNWMVGMDGNLQGFYNQSYGWQMYWSGGSLTVFKNAYGGGTGATVLDSSNYTSYSPSLTGSGASGSWNITAARATRANGNLYIDDNYGNGIVGVYSSYRYQGVFAMGDSYKLPADGTTTGSLYGMAWSHPNAGGVAGNLDSHGMLVLINGGFGSCMSYSIKASGNVTAYSDERLKTNWRPMPESFVERLAAVKVGIYDRTDGEQITQVGVSAQSLQEVLPEAVTKAADNMGTLSVSYGNAAMASSVELAKELVALKHKVTELEARIH